MTHYDDNLVRAIRRHSINKLKKLLAEGAYPEQLSSFGENPLFLAVREDEKEIVEIFLPLVDLKCKNTDGMNVLHVASLISRGNMVKILLQYIDPKIDNEGATSLHYAAMQGCDDIVEMLLPLVNPTTKDKYDNTPLDYAEKYDRIKIIEMINEQIEKNKNKRVIDLFTLLV